MKIGSGSGSGSVQESGWVGRRHESCAKRGMSHPDPPSSTLPHHKLIAYQVALERVKLVSSKETQY